MPSRPIMPLQPALHVAPPPLSNSQSRLDAQHPTICNHPCSVLCLDPINLLALLLSVRQPPWAVEYNTWLLIQLTPESVVLPPAPLVPVT